MADSRAADDLPRGLFAASQTPRLAVQAWLASRLVLCLTALVVAWLKDWPLTTVLTRWDAAHYLTVADQGYTSLTLAAFFPGLPMLLAGLGWLGLPGVVAGLLVSLVSSGLAGWALYRLAGRGVSGTVAVIAWSFAPVAVFSFVPYSESLFCAAALWSIWQARQGRWDWAGCLAAAGCLVRVSGLFLIAALVVAALVSPGSTRQRWQRLAWLSLPVAAVGAYVTFLRVRFGSWTTWLAAEVEGWGRTFHWPWVALRNTWQMAFGQGWVPPDQANAMFGWELAVWSLGLALTIWCLRRRRWSEAVWVGLPVLALSAQLWLVSVARTMLGWFPLFALVGGWAAARLSGVRALVRQGVFVVGFAVQLGVMQWWATRFFIGAWSG